MQCGMIGLGRMGGNMARRLMRGGHTLFVYDTGAPAIEALEADGATGCRTVEALVGAMQTPRAIWLSVPAGRITEDLIDQLAGLLAPGDTLVDAGNSNFHESMARAERLKARGIDFIDQGTSGGIWGLENGYCLMVGGDPAAYARLEPAFTTLAPAGGLLYTGPSGSGHFVKMVHNGIEYGMMQAYAEGFEILKASQFKGLNLGAIASMWNNGSVVRSWLLELAALAFQADPELKDLRGYVEDSGEGRWTLLEAIEKSVPAPVLALSLMMRFRSRQDDSFSAKVLAALRNQFGGHAVKHVP